jgi:hypothetical protein
MPDLQRALREELAIAWIRATSPLRRLFERLIRDGIPPPTTFQGLPPGQFPPIDAIKDELFGRTDGPRAGSSLVDAEIVHGIRIRSRGDPGAR